MDYVILAQTLIPVIVVAIAAKFLISSQDKQIATLLSLVDYQEEDIASLKATIDKYEDILVDIKSMNHPKQPLSLDEVQSEYDYQSDEGPDYISGSW